MQPHKSFLYSLNVWTINDCVHLKYYVDKPSYLTELNRNQIVFTIFQIIWNQTDVHFCEFKSKCSGCEV